MEINWDYLQSDTKHLEDEFKSSLLTHVRERVYNLDLYLNTSGDADVRFLASSSSSWVLQNDPQSVFLQSTIHLSSDNKVEEIFKEISILIDEIESTNLLKFMGSIVDIIHQGRKSHLLCYSYKDIGDWIEVGGDVDKSSNFRKNLIITKIALNFKIPTHIPND